MSVNRTNKRGDYEIYDTINEIFETGTDISILFVYFCFYLFNGYEFGATVESVFAPAILLLFSSLLVCQNFEIGSYLQAGVLAGLAVASTYFSDIINISQSRIMTFCFCCIMFAVVPGRV